MWIVVSRAVMHAQARPHRAHLSQSLPRAWAVHQGCLQCAPPLANSDRWDDMHTIIMQERHPIQPDLPYRSR